MYHKQGWGFNPQLVDDEPPPLVIAKFGLGVGSDPQKGQNPNSSLYRYKLMSDIIQTHPPKTLL